MVRPRGSDRLAAIAIEAAEQCERLTVPAIAAPVALDTWLTARARRRCPLLHADERGGGTPILAAVRRHPAAEILIGPEGGFTDDEPALLRADRRRCR